MEYPEIDAYSSMDSPIHRFDPRAKIVSFTFLIFSLVFVNDIRVAFSGLVFSFFILLVSRLPPGFALKRIRMVFFFLFPLLLVMPLTVEGREIANISGISVTLDGLIFASLIIMRALAAVTLALTMLATTRFDMTMKTLYALKIPGTLVQMLMFTYRYIFVITDEFSRMWESMECKGFSLKANYHGLSIFGNMLGMIIIKSYDRTRRVYESMVSKGYSGRPRTLVHLKMSAKDYVLSTCMVGIAIFVHAYQFI
ncbi:cobalt ECF transporter T component CbiQ [Methanolobus bombayensis]|uniref:cobalt ECF transporter T component CbiQ n=1 Tax=Methanolobus bombayensis TaxID=38023 RepID=UPI001AE34119|nr:cobalt ECF transporter T component CbiQ [Methanolobus bombayensis]MBP1910072.1 cobalt/nickel transport system permease protein [Methanolobus bombayensis]